jgi:hypothetical protein
MPDDRHERPIEVSKTAARQGTGPRQMVSVLTVSIALAAVLGALLILWFYLLPQPSPV